MRLLVPILLLSACAAPSSTPSPTASSTTGAPASPPNSGETPPASGRAAYSDKLQWMLERAAFFEDPDTPCLLRRPEQPAWVSDPAVRRRLREARSDSLWLGQWARSELRDRLAYAEITYDFTPVAGAPLPQSPPPLIYEIAVTGTDPIAPPALSDRAADVPVKVVYDVPYSYEEFLERREMGHGQAKATLDLIGEGGSPGGDWAVELMIYSEGGKPDPAALAQCDRLRRAYGLPVLMEFLPGRISAGPAPL